MVDRCRGTTKEGNPCGAKPRPGSDLCPWHDPALAARRSAWSAKGGQQRSNRARANKELPAEPMTLAELHSWLGIAFKRVIAGTMDPPIATAAANVARTMADLAKAAEVEARLAEVERVLGTGKAS